MELNQKCNTMCVLSDISRFISVSWYYNNIIYCSWFVEYRFKHETILIKYKICANKFGWMESEEQTIGEMITRKSIQNGKHEFYQIFRQAQLYWYSIKIFDIHFLCISQQVKPPQTIETSVIANNVACIWFWRYWVNKVWKSIALDHNCGNREIDTF